MRNPLKFYSFGGQLWGPGIPGRTVEDLDRKAPQTGHVSAGVFRVLSAPAPLTDEGSPAVLDSPHTPLSEVLEGTDTPVEVPGQEKGTEAPVEVIETPAQAPESAPVVDYRGMSMAELRAACRDREISMPRGAGKDKLIALLEG